MIQYLSICSISLLLLFINEGESQIRYGPIKKGGKQIRTKKYAKIPNFKGEASRIVGMTSQGRDLYVTTSVSGGYIYKITPNKKVTLWFNVAAGLKSIGRQLDFGNKIEGGIRGLAFHPNYKNNRLIYTSLMEKQTKKLSTYSFFSRTPITAKTHSVIYEWTVSAKTGKPGNPREVIRIGFRYYFHVLKQIIFQNNLLLITHGDGASDEIKDKGGQFKSNGLGKILRINPLKSGNKPYTVPTSNPFFNVKSTKSEIFALGFHNPHNLCLSKRKKDLFIGDTGRDNVEEINIVKNNQKGSRNYGWPKREGHFIHVNAGGVNTGISKLPKNDPTFKYVYPSAVVPHFGPKGKKFVGQSIASSCPIENGSPLSGLLLYSNFPTDGNIYYSFLSDLRKAKTSGPVNKLTWATTFKAEILYDHDDNPKTAPLKLPNLRAVIRKEAKLKTQERVDMRFGAGADGRIYWSSKKSGWIYIITNSFK